MTAPEIATLVGRMPVNDRGRYFDAERDYQRVSNFLKNIETDRYQLELWQQRMVAIGMAKRPDLVLGVSAAAQYDPATGKLTKDAASAINALCKDATKVAKAGAGATVGTAIHTATERLDCGESLESIGLPYPYNADLRAYDVLKRAMGLACRPEHIERSVRGAFDGVAGTLDRFYTSTLLEQKGILAPGELILADVKTEQDPLLNLQHICAQLATYANSTEMYVTSVAYEPMPRVNRDVGLVVHIRNGRATPILVNLNEGLHEAQAAENRKGRLARSRIKLGEPGCWALPVDVPLPPATELVATAHAKHIADMATDTISYKVAEPAPVEQAAQRGPDGLVRWAPTSEDVLYAGLLEQISVADGLPRLAQLFELAGKHGVPWAGDVEQAGAARARIVSCPQRALHTAASGGGCACGWTTGVAG